MLHEGGDQMVTALVLLRRAWGVRRWDRTSGGKVGSSSQVCGSSATPLGVAERVAAAATDVTLGVSGGSGTEQTDGHGGGRDDDCDAASEELHDSPN